MKDLKPSGQFAFSKLRDDAEKALAKKTLGEEGLDGKDIDAVFQELQVHQIELEMQNDELLRANEELEIQQMKFAGIYDLAPVGYFILDRRGIIEQVNNEAADQLNYYKSRITGKRLQDFIIPDHAVVYYNFFKAIATATEKQSCHLKFITGNGREFFAQLQGIAAQPYSNGQYYIAVIDITDRILAEQSLAKVKERLELALQASAAGTWELNPETMHFKLDQVSYNVCNINPESFNKHYLSFLEYIIEEDKTQVDQQFRTAINTGHPLDINCCFTGINNNVVYVNIRGHMVNKTANENSIVGIIIDITDKKLMEINAAIAISNQRRQITYATLIAQENERKRISEALHDSVSQLLYSIKIQLNQVNEENRIATIRHLNKLMDTAIQETRDISFELAPSILKDFGLPITLKDLAQRLSSPQLMIRVKTKGMHKRLDILLETNIFRIIQELINNSMKHSGAKLIEIHVIKNDSIEIIVADNGQGFDVKRLESRPRGTGMSSIKNRLSLYNGNMQVESSRLRGTKVTITLDV